MSANPIVNIDLTETFDHLPNAPIVEAVVDFRARAESLWEEEPISQILKSKLPDYPQRLSVSGIEQEFRIGPNIVPEGRTLETGWAGLRFQSEDGLHVAQFNRNGFTFSRLRPYDRWEQLIGEALRLWGMFMDVARPTEIQQMGLRFINRISIPPGDIVEDYLDPSPVQKPRGLDLPVALFFHQDVFSVPEYPYVVRFIKTIEKGQGPISSPLGLILDIDVQAHQPFDHNRELVELRLNEMRWLKNKLFYGNVTAKAVESFR